MSPYHPILVRERRADAIADLLGAVCGLLLAWLLSGCSHAPVAPPLMPLPDYPDAGEVNPCLGGPGAVSILSPAERRALCLHEVTP